MSYTTLNNMISSLAQTLEDQSDLSTAMLSSKLQKCLAKYPYDQTLGGISRVIEQMEMNRKLFIKKAQFKDLYKKYYTNNTKFAELFQEEVGDLTLSNPVQLMPHDESVKEIKYEVQDPILANHLAHAFDHTIAFKQYSERMEKQALKSVETTLNVWNLKPLKLQVNTGNDNLLIVQADYETPKGITSFYIPVDISKNYVKEAALFVGNSGPKDLNHINIKTYLTSQSGEKLKLNANSVFNILKQAYIENREVSNAEVALSRVIAKKQGFDTNGIVGQKLNTEPTPDVKIAKSNEFNSVEEQFTSAYGQAYWQFGDKVGIGINHIARELQSFGYKNPQISVLKSNSNTISYGISIDAGKIAFTVPVKLEQNKIQKPTLLICNGQINSFDKKAINQLYINNQTDYKIAAQSSILANEKPSDLINTIKIAMLEENYSKAQDALNVIKNSGNEQAYAIAFDTYLKGLNKEIKAHATNCTLIVKNSSSQHPVCGHTNLPIHKVYQDKDGNCRPLYRQGMDDKYEGVSFINAKIFG